MQLVFSKEEVVSGLTGKALDRLLSVSDCPEQCNLMAGQMSFVFEGWSDDDRSILEIIECRHFFKMLTASWPFWFHFLRRGGDDFGMVLALLCPVELHFQQDGVKLRFTDKTALESVCKHLVDGLTMLYSHIGRDGEEYVSALKRIEEEINVFV